MTAAELRWSRRLGFVATGATWYLGALSLSGYKLVAFATCLALALLANFVEGQASVRVRL